MHNKCTGIGLTNIPLVNLRIEYRRIYDFWLSGLLEEKSAQNDVISFNTGSVLAAARRHELATFTIQRSLLGLEVYVQSAARSAYVSRNPAGEYDWKTFPYAYQINGERRLAAQLYKCLPKLVDEKLSLAICNDNLYKWLLRIYECVRNPLFHGMEVQELANGSLRTMAMNIARTYQWLDSWYEPHEAFRPLQLNPEIFRFPNISAPD